MPKDLQSLANSLEAKAKQIDKAASDLAIKAAEAIVKDLVVKTPVDTSRAISNWIVTLDEPSNRSVQAHYLGRFGSTFGPSAAQTFYNAVQELKAKKPGQPIFITNNLNYIVDLNSGTSRQEPAGFVERAVLLARKLVAGSRLKISQNG